MWEQLWGSMTWGVIAVPTMGLIGMTLLVGALLGAAAVLYHKNLTKGAMTCAVLATVIGPLTGIAGQVTLPHSFTNGTKADAEEVNSNFDSLRDAFNATSGRLGPLASWNEGPLPTTSTCQGKLIGEVWLFAGSFAPQGTVFARGQLLEIDDYSSLYSVLGTWYGGDGRTNFGVPDLRGLEPEGVSYVICAGGIYPSRN
jgi:hypothetical protein